MSESNSRIRRGFTLLEVMIAVAILSIALMTIMDSTSQSIIGTNYARQLTVATLLARGKMIDIEQKLIEDGFGTFEETLTGTFEDDGFPSYTWKAELKKVKLAASSEALGLEGSEDSGAAAADAPAAPQSALLGPFTGQIESFTEQLSEAIRYCKLSVCWPQGKKNDECFDVVTHFVNMPGQTPGAAQQQISPAAAAPGGGLPGQGLPAPPGTAVPPVSGFNPGAAPNPASRLPNMLPNRPMLRNRLFNMGGGQ